MEDTKIYEEIIRLQKARVPAALATIVESSGSSPRKAGAKMVVREDGSILGSVGGGKNEAEVIAVAREAIRHGIARTLSFSLTEQHGSVCGGKTLIFIEPVTIPPHLVVVGSGHVGQAVARVAGRAGYAVSIINPEEIESDLTGNGAPQGTIDQLAKVFTSLGVDANTYIFIATRDHQKDFAVVKRALVTDACYIGMLGSARKRDVMKKVLADDGFDEGAIQRVVSPAGVAIGAETPEEIAISVVAQLIQTRRASHAAACRSDTAGSRTVNTDGLLQAAVASG